MIHLQPVNTVKLRNLTQDWVNNPFGELRNKQTTDGYPAFIQDGAGGCRTDTYFGIE